MWLSNEQVGRRLGHGVLGDVLHERERYAYLGGISRSTDELAEVDCVWYIRGKLAFLFEVEWTAMLGEPLLRKHAKIAPDERIVRFLVIPPERTELVRYKLARSPLLRAALEEGSWHILKSVHLRRFLAADDAGPRGSRAAARARSGHRARRASSCPCSAADGGDGRGGTL